MESVQTFEELKRTLKEHNPNLSEEDITKMASEGASSVYRNNWLLATTDLYQFSALRNALGVRFEEILWNEPSLIS